MNRENTATQNFIIQPGEGLIKITQKLEEVKLIRNRLVFFIIVKKLGIEKNIQAGDYRLSQSMNAEEIAKTLTHGTVESWITVIEGWRKEEIAEALTKKFNISEVEFNKKAPEGFLFPDTYLIPNDASAETTIKIMTNNFNKKFTPELHQKAEKLGLSEQATVTLASLVEREAKFNEDRPIVASILLRRLNEGVPLQVDATVQYALGYQDDEKTWWKKHLTNADLQKVSFYNTYSNKGLPPGPICNPGAASIQAVTNANPEIPYLFYVSDKKGRLHFAKTLEEHTVNIEKYLK